MSVFAIYADYHNMLMLNSPRVSMNIRYILSLCDLARIIKLIGITVLPCYCVFVTVIHISAWLLIDFMMLSWSVVPIILFIAYIEALGRNKFNVCFPSEIH
jgi:hypothetical protein